MGIISINGNSLDPKAPNLEAFNLVHETAKGSDYILIQTNSPLTKDIKETLAKKVEIQEKVSDDTYLCRYTSDVRTTDCIHKLELTLPLGPL